jgi:hypothetical protein
MTATHQSVAGLALAAPSPSLASPREIDHSAVKLAARDLLCALGADVDSFARDLQIQERLTTQIADWLHAELEPKGVGVVVEAEHLCMSGRGVQKLGAKTVTSALHGLVRDDLRTRQEFLALTTRTSHEH